MSQISPEIWGGGVINLHYLALPKIIMGLYHAK